MTEQLRSDELTEALRAYVPPAVARALVQRGPSVVAEAERLEAAVLLADVSGFTALAERLARLGSEGAEELTVLLNRYFSRMIGLLDEAGGEVVQFSGDALIAVFPAIVPAALPSCAARAWAAAAHMQEAMAEFGTSETSVGPVSLAMKVAVGAGEVLACSVGGVSGSWQYLIAGDPLRQVAEAEHTARRGESRLSPEAALLLAQVASTSPRLLPPAATLDFEGVSADALRAYVPQMIAARLLADQGDWLAELRCLTVMFIGVGGLDYAAADALERTQGWMAAFQRSVLRYEGSINKLLVDDKGTVGLALFGAPPFAHEDDPLRAVACALALQREAEAQGLQLAIGITTGQIFAGPVGSPSRREYTVIGDSVNLAARLMQLAGQGRVLCDHATRTAVSNAAQWQTLPPQTVKGRAAAVLIHEPLALQAARQQVDHRSLQLVGRKAERERLVAALDGLRAGNAELLCIEGESGMGKSRLLAELERLAEQRGLACLLGSGQAIEQQTPYRAWRDVFEGYFGLDAIDSQVQRRDQVLSRLRYVAPLLLERAPLLNDLLGLGIPETPLTGGLEPRLRQASLQAMLVDLLEHWAAEQPLLVLLDDAGWLDSLSWQLALQVARSLAEHALLLVFSLQPPDELDDEHPYRLLRGAAWATTMTLGTLDGPEVVELAALRLGVRALPADVADLIQRRATGHPFVAEELVLSLRDTGVVEVLNGDCLLRRPLDEMVLPDTVQGMVLSRIDRLPAPEQLTIKVASVIGRAFGLPILCGVHPTGLLEQVILDHADDLVRRDLLLPPDEYTMLRSYAFKQLVAQEVTYGTLPHTRRRELHAEVARWYERHLSADAPERLPLLAYHWRQARDQEREQHFAGLAGEQLARSYANAEAISFLSRALELTDEPQTRAQLLWERFQVYERIGDREAQRSEIEALQQIATARGDLRQQAQVCNAWAALHRDLSEYPAAVAALARALDLAQQAADDSAQVRSLTLWGQVLEYQGLYAEARSYFEQALQLYRTMDYRRGEANNLSNLGNIHYYMNEFETARHYDLQALAIRREIGDKVGEAVSLTNLSQASFKLGAQPDALRYQQEALAIARSIGDRSGEATILATIGQDNLLQGNYAASQQQLEEATRISEGLGDRRSEAIYQQDLGCLLRDIGNYDGARHCLKHAIKLFEVLKEQGFAAFACLNLGYVLLDSDAAAALAYYQQALEYARASGRLDAEAYALSYRAFYHEQQAAWPEAERHYAAALAICEQIDSPAMAAEQWAGRARVALACGHTHEALGWASRCREHLAEQGIAGIEFPLLVYLTCHDVLLAAGQTDDAWETISTAHALLMARADALTDPETRTGLLERVPTNRRVGAAFRALQASRR